jgi:serine/threonine protein kinase
MKLTVLAEIASGGMGSVEMALVESGALAGQVLAIKRLHQNIANDQQFVDMFLDEAWLTAAMKSRNVISVAAHGTDERGMFLAVELVEGVPLSRLLKEARVKKETFSEQVVACIAMQICDGLLEAHTLKGSDGRPLGLVHRDLTPGNILVAFDGTVKIADFGIAKAEERITHTRTGTMKGKPAYMAPEQAKGGKSMDLRADLFSLGVMMFELLAGRRPWLEKSAFDVIMAAALKPHPSIAEMRAGVSPVFVEIIDKCLAKKAAERWGSAAEIRAKLEAWRRAQSFPKDDLEVLREFVGRNSQAQIEWFRRARLGELAKGQAQTFKELEEAIDEARKKSGEAPLSMVPPPNSSGRAALDAMTPSKPMLLVVDELGSTGARAAAPAPGPEPIPLAGTGKTPAAAPPHATTTMPSLTDEAQEAQRRVGLLPRQPPSSRPPQTQPLPAAMTARGRLNTPLSGTIAMSDADLAGIAAPAQTGQFGPPSGVRKGLGGTEFMEVSPLKGMKLPQPKVESSESDMTATIRMPELSDRPVRDVDGSSRSVIRPVGALLEGDDVAPLGQTLSTEEAQANALRGEQGRQEAAGWDLRASAQQRAAEAQAPARGLAPSTVIVLILVAFLAGGGIAAWFAKTYLMKPAGELPAATFMIDVPV